MAITTKCPGCTAIFRLPEELAGRPVRCQKCERMFVVPLPTVGQGMPLPSVNEAEAPNEVLEESVPEPEASVQTEPIPEAATVAPMLEAKPSEDAAPTPKVEGPAPVAPPERPPSRLWTAAVVGLFMLGLCATGAFAAIWVATHLSPPPRVVLVPPLKESNREPVLLRDRKDFIDGQKDRFNDINIKGAVPPTWLFLGKDQWLQKTDRLVRPRADRNHGPFRVYQIRLERDKRYNFFVRARGFNPQLKILQADLPFAVGEFSAEKRLFVSYAPKVEGDYTLWITSLPHQDGDFDLQVALEQSDVPKVVDLRTLPSANFTEALRVQNQRDPIWNPTFGPYHEYRVMLEANTDYVFKINEKNPDPSYQPVLQVWDNLWVNHGADPGTRRLIFPFRAHQTREYRFRVTAADYGEGVYNLAIERKTVAKPPVPSKQLVRYIVAFDGQGRYEEGHSMMVRDPLEPSAAGRGAYKEYIVKLIKGQTYRIEVASKRFPPMVSLFDDQNKQVAHNKGAATASIDFTPNQTGGYFVRAIATHPFDRGPYTIKIAETP